MCEGKQQPIVEVALEQEHNNKHTVPEKVLVLCGCTMYVKDHNTDPFSPIA